MPTANRPFVLFTRCVDEQTSEHVDRLDNMTARALEISKETFFRHVSLPRLAARLGYAYGRHAPGLRLTSDRCVRFYRSSWQGKRCYYLDWSRIEHVFLTPEDIRALGRSVPAF